MTDTTALKHGSLLQEYAAELTPTPEELAVALGPVGGRGGLGEGGGADEGGLPPSGLRSSSSVRKAWGETAGGERFVMPVAP